MDMKELRVILFTDTEIYTALKEGRQTRKEFFPTGSYLKMDFESRKILTICITTQNQDGEHVETRFKEEEISAALVAYCLKRKIPMPAKGKKTLTLMGKALALIVTLNF